ncbi:MAG: SET domain-containing protein [Minisyncoccia bacterium]|jgi:hypothetical protein
MDKSLLIANLKNGVYVRPQPSPLGGVGLFAIRDIPPGIDPFPGDNIEFTEIPEAEIMNDPAIPESVKKYVDDICVYRENCYLVPKDGLNNITISSFINYSTTPNIKVDSVGGRFTSLREIKAGEELTSDYATYNDGPVL